MDTGDVLEYDDALEKLDPGLGCFLSTVEPQDLAITIANYGDNPTYRRTARTRERVSLFVLHRNKTGDLGTQKIFADATGSLARFFELPNISPPGSSFL
jgi:phosphopentomutase